MAGINTSVSVGVYGNSHAGGAGVEGQSGMGDGVLGTASGGVGVNGQSTDGHGVYGYSSNGIGVQGTSQGGSYGVVGESSANGIAVYGTVNSGGIGVFGQTTSGSAAVYGEDSADGVGVRGISNSNYGTSGSSISNYGIYGNSGSMAGVYGVSSTANGVVGHAPGPGYGVYGTSPVAGVAGLSAGSAGMGVSGTATGANGMGIYGLMSGSATYAGYFAGNVKVTSALTVDGVSCCPSDERLKKNIEPVKGALQQLAKLRPVTFNWKDPDKHGGRTGTQHGFVAQEVESVFPEWVVTDPDGYKALDVRGLEPLEVESLQTLKAENDEFRARLSAVEERPRSPEGRGGTQLPRRRLGRRWPRARQLDHHLPPEAVAADGAGVASGASGVAEELRWREPRSREGTRSSRSQTRPRRARSSPGRSSTTLCRCGSRAGVCCRCAPRFRVRDQ